MGKRCRGLRPRQRYAQSYLYAQELRCEKLISVFRNVIPVRISNFVRNAAGVADPGSVYPPHKKSPNCEVRAFTIFKESYNPFAFLTTSSAMFCGTNS